MLVAPTFTINTWANVRVSRHRTGLGGCPLAKFAALVGALLQALPFVIGLKALLLLVTALYAFPFVTRDGSRHRSRERARRRRASNELGEKESWRHKVSQAERKGHEPSRPGLPRWSGRKAAASPPYPDLGGSEAFVRAPFFNPTT